MREVSGRLLFAIRVMRRGRSQGGGREAWKPNISLRDRKEDNTKHIYTNKDNKKETLIVLDVFYSGQELTILEPFVMNNGANMLNHSE